MPTGTTPESTHGTHLRLPLTFSLDLEVVIGYEHITIHCAAGALGFVHFTVNQPS